MIPGEETVSLVTFTRTRDSYDNFTDVAAVDDLPGCLFEPEQSVERSDPRSPGVAGPARIYAHAGAPDIPATAILVRPPGAHLDDDGRLVIDGEAWAVDGSVERWPAVVVPLTRWKSPA